MVLALLLLLLGQAVSGIIINNDVADEGPLTELMPVWLANLITDLHVYLWDMLLLAIGLHVAVIFIYVLLKKQNLLRPMITGTKLLPAVQAPPYIRPAMLALLVFGITAIVTALIANFV